MPSQATAATAAAVLRDPSSSQMEVWTVGFQEEGLEFRVLG